MSGPFIFIGTNKVRAGKLDAEREHVPNWVRFIADNEPRTIGFNEYLSADGTEVEIVQIHPDAESFEHHLRVLAERSDRDYQDTLDGTTAIRIFGTPTETILRILKESVGPDVPVSVHPEFLGGFTRVG